MYIDDTLLELSVQPFVCIISIVPNSFRDFPIFRLV